jgi:hypothetical protein
MKLLLDHPFVILMIGSLIAGGCINSESQNTAAKTNNDPDTSKSVTIKPDVYGEPDVPVFFKELVANHQDHFHQIRPKPYRSLCAQYKLKEADSGNQRIFYTVKILHKLFTAKTANDYSTGPILTIPYIWHWRKPNPRSSIRLAKSGTPLSKIDPPQKFDQYPSYAKIDRTPDLYFKDLCTRKPKYMAPAHVNKCDTFRTFGWCSERAMAFVCLMDMMGFKGKVIAQPPHSWSEFLVPMENKSGDKILFKVKVDNTYDIVEWERVSSKKSVFSRWSRLEEQAKRGEWYNRKAHSEAIQRTLRQTRVPMSVTSMIETKVISYLRDKMEAAK